MGISDILGKLIGKGPDESVGTALAGNVFTPGVESLLSAVPALVGAYEQGRGKPLGNVLSTLGQFGLTNAANRQKQHQDEGDVAARIESLASRGLAPQQGTLDAIDRMTPEAADKELSDVESDQVKEQQRQQAIQQKRDEYNITHQRPFYLSPTGKEAYLPDPTGKTFGTRAPQYDKPAGAEYKSDRDMFLRDRLGWNAMMAAKSQYSIDQLGPKTTAIAQAKMNYKLDHTPIGMLPEMRTSVVLDRNTLLPADINKISARDALTTDKYTSVDRKTATETLPNLRIGRKDVMELAAYADKVLPSGGGNEASFGNFVKTLGTRWGLPFKAVSGGVNEAMFENKRTAVALQLQKVFTGSTRPVNQVEFTRITGDSDPGLISMKDIEAVLPTSGDTREVAHAKYVALDEMFADKLAQLNAASGAPGAYFKVVGDSADEAATAVGGAPDSTESVAPDDTTGDGGEDLK